nr:hypothetical protein [Arachnia propionica]
MVVVEGCGELLLGAFGPFWLEADAGHMAFDGFFDQRHGQVGHVAVAFLAATAEVVGVGAAFALGLGVDEAAGASLGSAAVAEEDAGFEVVVVDAVAGVVGAQGSDVLDAVEEFLADQGLVAALELFTFEGDDAGVVGVGEQAVQRGDGDGPRRRVAAGRSGFQAEVGHGDLELLDGVVASGV